jgi:predicted  nucleic acid-binding Zn-ribbon protein
MYWNLINDSSREDRSENTIDSNTWLNHFQNLSKTVDIYSERLDTLQRNLEELESTKIFNALDFPIK